MVEMTVETDLTNCIVITNVQTISSNAIVMDDAFSVHINVMETKTVRMGLTKPTKFVTTESVTKKQSSRVQMENVSRYYGNAILITIVGTIVTNQHIFAVITTAPLDGAVVQAMLIIAASLNGYFVTERMIVEMAQMNLQKIVHLVRKRVISNVKIEDVFQSAGSVISKTIVEITPMSKMIFVQTKVTENVPNRSSGVITQNVFLLDGNVIMMTIAEMDRTKENVQIIHARQIGFNVTVGIVSKKN